MVCLGKSAKVFSILLFAVAITLSACASQRRSATASEHPQPAPHPGSASPRTQTAAAQTTTTAGGVEKDARYWQELTNIFKPVDMPSMKDHRAYMLPGGTVLALHHDNMDLSKAQHLNWVALGIPGKFCKDDQERVDRQFGNGQQIFTHFHDMKNDTHGGKPGADGVWFVHVAVREFDSPMGGGRVKPGPDKTFMPTPAPQC